MLINIPLSINDNTVLLLVSFVTLNKAVRELELLHNTTKTKIKFYYAMGKVVFVVGLCMLF